MDGFAKRGFRKVSYGRKNRVKSQNVCCVECFTSFSFSKFSPFSSIFDTNHKQLPLKKTVFAVPVNTNGSFKNHRNSKGIIVKNSIEDKINNIYKTTKIKIDPVNPAGSLSLV